MTLENIPHAIYSINAEHQIKDHTNLHQYHVFDILARWILKFAHELDQLGFTTAGLSHDDHRNATSTQFKPEEMSFSNVNLC